MGRGGIGVLVLNHGNQKAADMVREFIVRQSTSLVSYQTYPIGDMMKRYAVTAFIHAGKRKRKTNHLLIPTLKLQQPIYLDQTSYISTYYPTPKLNKKLT